MIRHRLVALAAAIVVSAMLSSCRQRTSTGPGLERVPPPAGAPIRSPEAPATVAPTREDAQMLLGNPDGATKNAANREHYLMTRPEYALSYNDELRFPNWVSWRLTADDVGSVERGQFVPDPDLPAGFNRITTSDYTRSGYDRGHNCPSKDRSATREQNDVVFYMTNITPQAHGMNAGPWERLESFCRTLAQDGNDLYITCGHGFSSPTHGTIGRDQIAVPDFGWKVVVVVPPGSGDPLARITPRTRVIAVKMPNISTISRQDWQRYVVTPAEIEKDTGLRLFANLPADVADPLRNKLDTSRAGAGLLGPGGPPGPAGDAGSEGGSHRRRSNRRRGGE
jgi:endonuclease G